MGSRKRKLQGAPRKWSSEEIITLLAWLDYSLKYPKIDFEATIVDRLNNEFSSQKIYRKLELLWQNHGPHTVPKGTKGIDDVLSRGSSALENLQLDRKEGVAKETKRLEDSKARRLNNVKQSSNHQIRQASEFEPVPRTLIPTISPSLEDVQPLILYHLKQKPESSSFTPTSTLPRYAKYDSISPCSLVSRKKQKTYSKRKV
jgi:hypothetical protein